MATYFWVGGTGTWDASSTANWALTSGGLPGIAAPTNADTVTFDSASGTGTCTTAAGSVCATATLNSATLGLTLGANHTMSGLFTLQLGTLTIGNFILTCDRLSSTNSNIRNITFGSGSINVTGNSATVWTNATSTNFTISGTSKVNCVYAGSTGTRTISTSATSGEAHAINFNISAGSDTIFFANGSAPGSVNFTGYTGTSAVNNATRTFYGDLTLAPNMTFASGTAVTSFRSTANQQITTNGVTLDFPLTFNGIGGTFAFQDALTQGSTRAFTITNGTVQLKSGVTSTVGSFVANNANTKSLQSTTPGSQATISQASGTVTVADLSIRDSNAIGGASWTAYADYENTDAGNNDGWNFGLSPPYESYEPPIIIRSFTQPRRF
jgi:hypothetical protein